MKTDCNHGWVWPRADGAKAKCGGPKLCPYCAVDLRNKNASREAVYAYTGPVSLMRRDFEEGVADAAVILMANAFDMNEAGELRRVRLQLTLADAKDLHRSLGSIIENLVTGE